MKSADHLVNGGHAILLSHLGQMSIAGCRGWAGMAEQSLNMTQAQAPFEQMGGKTVAQGMDRDFFLMPHSLMSTFMADWVLPRFICVVA